MKQNSTELQGTAVSSGPGDPREEAGLLESRNAEGNLTGWTPPSCCWCPSGHNKAVWGGQNKKGNRNKLFIGKHPAKKSKNTGISSLSLCWNSSSNAPVPAGQSKEKGGLGPERLVPEVGKTCISMPRTYEAMQLKLTPPSPPFLPLFL